MPGKLEEDRNFVRCCYAVHCGSRLTTAPIQRGRFSMPFYTDNHRSISQALLGWTRSQAHLVCTSYPSQTIACSLVKLLGILQEFHIPTRLHATGCR